MRLLAIAFVVGATACQLVYPTRELTGGAQPNDAGARDVVAAANDAPVRDAWPDETNTGPLGTPLRASGSVTISTAGQTIDGLDIEGTVTITGNDTTLSHCRVTSGENFVVSVDANATGVKIEDCDIAGTKAHGSTGVVGPATVVRCNVHGLETGIALTGDHVGVSDSYIHDLDADHGGSFYGVKMDGPTSNVAIVHNVITHEQSATAAVSIDNYYGTQNDILVDRNKLKGGGYPFYSDASFTGGSIKGVKLTNNRLTKGGYGYVSIKENDIEATNNVDDDTGAPVVF